MRASKPKKGGHLYGNDRPKWQRSPEMATIARMLPITRLAKCIISRALRRSIQWVGECRWLNAKAALIQILTRTLILVANFQLTDIPIVEIDHLIEHLQLIAPVPLERLIVHSECST